MNHISSEVPPTELHSETRGNVYLLEGDVVQDEKVNHIAPAGVQRIHPGQLAGRSFGIGSLGNVREYESKLTVEGGLAVGKQALLGRVQLPRPGRQVGYYIRIV